MAGGGATGDGATGDRGAGAGKVRSEFVLASFNELEVGEWTETSTSSLSESPTHAPPTASNPSAATVKPAFERLGAVGRGGALRSGSRRVFMAVEVIGIEFRRRLDRSPNSPCARRPSADSSARVILIFLADFAVPDPLRGGGSASLQLISRHGVRLKLFPCKYLSFWQEPAD